MQVINKFCISLFIYVCCIGCSGGFITDKELIDNFQSKKTDFGRLLQMFSRDSIISVVAPDYVIKADGYRYVPVKGEPLFSPERFSRYKELFKKLELPFGIERNDTAILFIAQSEGLGIGGSDKGYAYRATPPNKPVSNLDRGTALINSKHPIVYRKVEGNWYLFFRAD